MELCELPILESVDLNLKSCAFKFLIVLLLCYDILFYFSLYSSLAVTKGLYMYYSICSYCIKFTVDIAKISHPESLF